MIHVSTSKGILRIRVSRIASVLDSDISRNDETHTVFVKYGEGGEDRLDFDDENEKQVFLRALENKIDQMDYMEN